MKKTILNTTILAAAGMIGTGASHAAATFTGATFSNLTVVQDDAAALVITADVTVGGAVVGALDASLTKVGGTPGFNTSSWSASGQLNATGQGGASTGDDTGIGDWAFTITPIAGWQVDGISTFTNGTVLGNPIYSNITSNGAATLQEDITGGLGAGLITNAADGDSIANGGSLNFGIGSNVNGINGVDHSNLWSLDFAGASTIGFRYSAGTQVGGEVPTLGGEALRIDASLSEAPPVPEPSAGLLAAFGGLLLLRRRR